MQDTAKPYAPTADELSHPHGTLIKSMNWGYDGGGMACGPMAGSSIVELAILNPDNSVMYASYSLLGRYGQIRFARRPLFAGLMNLPHVHGNDFDAALARIVDATAEQFDFELDDPDSMAPLDDAPYRNITRLLRLAMQACCQLEEPAREDAEAFIAPYLSGDLNAMEIPPAAGMPGKR